MKKVLWLFVCLMTMVVSLTSCNEKTTDKFNLVMDNIAINTNEWTMIEKTLAEIENYFYLSSKYDLKHISYLKTKIQIHTDSLVVGEIYTRGKNSFDGGTAQHNVFIYYVNKENTYFYFDAEMVPLIMRAEAEVGLSEKNNIFVRYVKKHGILNNETLYENVVRNVDKKDVKDIKFYKKYLDKELDIN